MRVFALPTRKLAGKLFKIALITGIVFFIIFSVMARLGGNSPLYKEAMEGFVGGLFGGTAQAGAFEGLKFFPTIWLDIGQIVVTDAQGAQMGEIARAQVALGFWDMVFSTGKIARLNIEGLSARAGIFGPAELSLDQGAIFEKDGEVYFKAEGAWGQLPFFLRAGMESLGTPQKPRYGFGKSRNLQARLGGVAVFADLRDSSFGTLEIQNFSFSMPEESARGELAFKRRWFGAPKISGRLDFSRGSAFEPDLNIEHKDDQLSLSGIVHVPSLQEADFFSAENPWRAFEELSFLSSILPDISLALEFVFDEKTPLPLAEIQAVLKETELRFLSEEHDSGKARLSGLWRFSPQESVRAP